MAEHKTMQSHHEFASTMDELLHNLRAVFPECNKVKDAHEQFSLLVRPNDHAKHMLIEKWHTSMGDLYDACDRRDMETLFKADLGTFKRLDLYTKWRDPTFNAESRDNIWGYIDVLNDHSKEYYAHLRRASHLEQCVPKTIFDRLERATVARGADNLRDPAAVMAMCNDLVSEIPEEEMMEMLHNMPQIINMMKETPEGKRAARMASQGGGPDVAGFLAMFQQPPPPKH